MSKFLDIINLVNGLSTNVKVFIVIVLIAFVLTKLTPGENRS